MINYPRPEQNSESKLGIVHNVLFTNCSLLFVSLVVKYQNELPGGLAANLTLCHHFIVDGKEHD